MAIIADPPRVLIGFGLVLQRSVSSVQSGGGQFTRPSFLSSYAMQKSSSFVSSLHRNRFWPALHPKRIAVKEKMENALKFTKNPEQITECWNSRTSLM